MQSRERGGHTTYNLLGSDKKSVADVGKPVDDCDGNIREYVVINRECWVH